MKSILQKMLIAASGLAITIFSPSVSAQGWPPATTPIDWRVMTAANRTALCNLYSGRNCYGTSMWSILCRSSAATCFYNYLAERIFDCSDNSCIIAGSNRSIKYSEDQIPWPAVGCADEGQKYDVEINACTLPRDLGVGDSEDRRVASCGEGLFGELEQIRYGTGTKFGWVTALTPRTEEVSYMVGHQWGDWEVLAGSCIGGNSDGSWANIHFGSDPSNPFRVDLSLSQTGGGCTSGYTFQAQYEGCVRSVTQTSSRSCTPSPTADYVANSGSQSRSRTLRQHQMAGKGSTVGTYPRIVHTGAWGSYGTCRGGTPKPPEPSTPSEPVDPNKPTVGTTFSFATNLICSSADSGYSYMPSGTAEELVCVTTSFKNSIISAYRGNGYGRCPEPSGFNYWVRSVLVYHGRGDSCNVAQSSVLGNVRSELRNEDGSWNCQAAAQSKWPGVSLTAEMIAGTGRNCRVTTVN